MRYDYLIVGQGLAGSLLAFKLIQRGLKVCVIDNNHQQSASMVAAGIINPITGLRLSLTDDFSDFQKPALACYNELEAVFSTRFYHPVEQQRLIKNETQLAYFKQRTNDKMYYGFLGTLTHTTDSFKANKYGQIGIEQSAYVGVKSLLLSIKQWLIERESYLNTAFNIAELKTSDSTFSIAGISGNKIIFCEGHQAINNPWLSHLPFKLSKGEILSLATPSTKQMPMLNWGNWLLPTGINEYRLGSNYAWNDLSDSCSEKVKEQLLESLNQQTLLAGQLAVTQSQIKVTAHASGIRPTTEKRIPFIGEVSNHKNAYCFNGFGSKGCLLIPRYADMLIEFLTSKKPLPEKLTQYL